MWSAWGSPTDWVVLLGMQYRSSNWLWTEVEVGADNQVMAVGCPNDEEADTCWEASITKVTLPKWWLMGGEFFDISPDTPYKVMVGAKLPECPGAAALNSWNKERTSAATGAQRVLLVSLSSQ